MHSSRRNQGLVAGLMSILLSAACRGEDREPRHPVVRAPNEIEFTAIVNAKGFDSGWVMPGYHAIVWKGGRMAHAALLQADSSDTQILDAFAKLGASPGNNLPMEV